MQYACTSSVMTKCGMFGMCCMQWCMFVSAVFIVRGCAVSRRYKDVCNCDMFSVVNVYLDHLKLCVCVLLVDGMSVVVNVMVSLMSVMSPPPAFCNLSVRTVVKLCTFGVCALGMSLVS